MKQKAARIRRILEVQRQLDRVARQQLNDLNQSIEDMSSEEKSLLVNLSETDAKNDLQIGLATKRLSSISKRKSQSRNAAEAQSKLARQQAARLKMFEKMSETAERLSEKENEKVDLEDVVDQSLRRSTITPQLD